MRSMDIASTGCWLSSSTSETISNNIATSTPPVQRQRAEFQDLLYQSQRRVGSASSDQGTSSRRACRSHPL